MALIEFHSLDKVYPNGPIAFQALKGIDLTVEEAEFLAIAGPSGSGKTTLLNIIGCLDTATSGQYLFQEQDSSKLSANQLAELRRHGIGFIFQTFNLIPVLSAYENVEFPLLLKGDLNPSERRSQISAILENVGLKDLMQRRPHELSGGQQQRVAIARALVKRPKLILADEPTANLDSQTGQDILAMMRQINRQYGTTFIFSTHDQMVMDQAQRIVTLRDGQISSDQRRG